MLLQMATLSSNEEWQQSLCGHWEAFNKVLIYEAKIATHMKTYVHKWVVFNPLSRMIFYELKIWRRIRI